MSEIIEPAWASKYKIKDARVSLKERKYNSSKITLEEAWELEQILIIAQELLKRMENDQ